jgi:Bacteriophage tail sheath protein
MAALQVPGVYLAERVERRAPVLPTGVPAFVGLVSTASYGPVALHRKEDFAGSAVGHLGDAIAGFFDNGGVYCYVIGVHSATDRDHPVTPAEAAGLASALTLLAPLQDIDLVAIPDADAVRTADGVDEAIFLQVQRGLLQHCTEQADRIALLDALPSKDASRVIDDQVKKLGLAGNGPINAALYHPWIRTATGGDQLVPPCGHIAGIIARADALGGVSAAPANIEVLGATDLAADLDAASVGFLNERGVNCLRAFAARGIRVWGARTLSSAPDWRFLNVRRLVLTLRRWIDLNMSWAAFEPNVPALWARIQRELTHYLQQLWSAGALQGSSSDEAFFVRCDAELNPPEVREAGQVITQIGLAPAVPAEFIVVSVQHRAGTTELL